MLQRVEITNFALIAKLDLELGAGVNVFSGETGAGKSILLDALSFLLGSRANPSWIRSGCERMSVSGTFLLHHNERLRRMFSELSLSDPDEDDGSVAATEMKRLLIWRELQQNGRSQARINGLPVTVSVLRSLGSELLEMQGQQETMQLLQPKQHLRILDQFGGTDHRKLCAAYRLLYEEWKAAAQRQELLLAEEREAIRSEELWCYQEKEIRLAAPQEGEDEKLEQRLSLLRGVQRLQHGVSQALSAIALDEDQHTSAQTLLYRAKRELEGIQRYDARFIPWIEVLDALYWQTDELNRELTGYLAELEAEPGEQEAIEERLEQIRRLKRKYGATIAEILNYRADILQKMENLQRHEEKLRCIEQEYARLTEELHRIGAKLSASRQSVAATLRDAVTEHLAALLMPECRFQVVLTPYQRQSALEASGMESCEFFIAPNRGEPLKPLVRIASGGELARILLALKSALVAAEMPDIMIFDEPDSGLSGAAVKAMAAALAKLGYHCQLLLVTHQAAVAAVARQHFLISKKTDNEQTYTCVMRLDHEGRLQEMMRLLAADKRSLPARIHAEELLREAHQILEQ